MTHHHDPASVREAPLFMVFDVESIGLHGEGFAVGYTVVDRSGARHEEGVFACPPIEAYGTSEDRQWITENIPVIPPTHTSPGHVRLAFWTKWLEWKERGAVLVADCAWPVEARFLAEAVDDFADEHKWQGPYPLHDLASVLLARGLDPLATNERLADELPVHDPLADARQSARLLIETLSATPAVQPAAQEELVRAARNVLAAVDHNLDAKNPPGKYTVPWAEMTALRAALKERAQPPAATQEKPPSREMDADEWRELFRLREAVKGPEGFSTWQEAATHERMRRVKAERALAASTPSPAAPTGLHPRTADLVDRFAQALKEKLAAAEKKYDYSDGWADDDWMRECQGQLASHVEKGDPRDVAAYCAFMWHHGWSTAAPTAPEGAQQ